MLGAARLAVLAAKAVIRLRRDSSKLWGDAIVLVPSDVRIALHARISVRAWNQQRQPVQRSGSRVPIQRSRRAPIRVESDESSGRVRLRQVNPTRQVFNQQRPDHVRNVGVECVKPAQARSERDRTDCFAGRSAVVAVSVDATAMTIRHIDDAGVAQKHIKRHGRRTGRKHNSADREDGNKCYREKADF